MIALLFLLMTVRGQAVPDEASLRAAVQRFYNAQAARDLRATVSSWSAAAHDRPTDDTYKVIFDTGEDRFTIDVRSLSIVGTAAQVRVLVGRVRTAHEPGGDKEYRGSALNNQQWRFEDGTWRLVRDKAVDEDVADLLLGTPSGRWPQLLADNRDDVTRSLRSTIAGRAGNLAASGRYQDAVSAFQLLLAVDRFRADRGGEIESLQNLANTYYFMRDFATASAVYREALERAQEAGAEEQAALAHTGLGTVAYSQAEYSAALAEYDAARSIYAQRDEGSSVGRALINIGNVQFLQADYDPAAASYRQALDLLSRAEDYPGAATARSALGRVFATQGDLGPALRTFESVLSDARARLSPSQYASAYESLAEVQYRLGDADRARASFGRSVALFETLLRDAESAARVYGELGLTELSAGHADAALDAYTKSRGQWNEAGRPDGVAHAWVGIGFSYAAARKFDQAIPAYRTAIGMLDAQQRAEDSARAWLGLSLAQSGGGDHDAALTAARHVRAAAESLDNDELRWRAAVREGAVLRRLNRTAEAKASLSVAIDAIERLLPDIATSAEARAKLDDSASAWGELAFTLAADHDAAGALLAAERRLAHARRLMLAPFERDVSAGMTPDERRDEERLTREIISTRAQTRAESGNAHPDAARLSRLEQQLTSLLADRASRQSAVYARLPALRGWRAVDLPSEVPSGVLPDRGALVEYIVNDDEQLVLWMTTTPDGPSYGAAIVATTRLQLADAIARALDPASLADAREWRERAASLAETLLGPVRTLVERTTRCIVVPDDLLWRVPFEALPLGDRDLAARTAVTYASSIVALARHREPPESVASRVAVIAPTAVPVLPDGEAAARAAIASATLAALATPVEMSGAAPMFSSLLLTPAGDSMDDDGRLEVRELFTITSPGGVLIAADGRSFDRQGIGAAMQALDWAAAAAGLSAFVIGRSAAYAPSAQATALMTHLAAGERVSDAWRGATADVRATAGAAPASWAALRLLGRAGWD